MNGNDKEPTRPREVPPGAPPGRPRVLLVTATIGAGHNSVARALIEQFRLTAPNVEIRCEDAVRFMPWAFRAYYVSGFSLTMSHLHGCYSLGFRLSNHPQRPGRGRIERMRLWIERRAMRRLLDLALQWRPDLVLNTHFLAAPMYGRAIGRGELPTRQVAVVTDLEVHRFWYAENVEQWFTASDYSAETLRRWGVEPARIEVAGMPIHPKWSHTPDRAKVLADWRLPADRPIVLLSGGTEFQCLPVHRIARALLDALPDIHLVVLAGRTKSLLAKLAKFPEAGARLTPQGFTDRVNELVEVATLMLTKAGGITTAECAARGLPMVLMNPIAGHEGGNATYLAGTGAAVIARGVKEIASTTRRLLDDPGQLAKMAASARRLPQGGVEKVVRTICRMLAPSSSPPAPPAP